jgi:tRNA pseudouridine55 synthase
VDKIRRTFRFRKTGHGGSLDPQATGLLILLIGRGTKLSNRFLGADKTYEGIMHMGIATNSQDADGEVVSEAPIDGITRDQVEACMKNLTGDSFQTPPMVSAVKVDGVPLYKRARKGQTVERKPRLIHVYEFLLDTWDPPRVAFRCTCTKGTYVRTLCADIGDALGCGAHLSALRRTRCGDLSIDDAAPLDDLLKLESRDLVKRIIPMYKFSQTGPARPA